MPRYLALIFAHLGNGLFLPTGYEFVLTLFAANICLALAGPGAAALDGMLGEKQRIGTQRSFPGALSLISLLLKSRKQGFEKGLKLFDVRFATGQATPGNF